MVTSGMGISVLPATALTPKYAMPLREGDRLRGAGAVAPHRAREPRRFSPPRGARRDRRGDPEARAADRAGRRRDSGRRRRARVSARSKRGNGGPAGAPAPRIRLARMLISGALPFASRSRFDHDESTGVRCKRLRRHQPRAVPCGARRRRARGGAPAGDARGARLARVRRPGGGRCARPRDLDPLRWTGSTSPTTSCIRWPRGPTSRGSIGWPPRISAMPPRAPA